MDGDYSPIEVADLLAREAIQVIDVRQRYEHEAARIDGSRLIELAELQTEATTLDRDRPIVFYCYSGGRSAAATEAFRAAGFNAHNMVGGIAAWAAAGLPMAPENASITH